MLQRLPIALASKSRKYIWKVIKWNQTNYIFFVLSKWNYKKGIQENNEFNKVVKQNGYNIYEFWE